MFRPVTFLSLALLLAVAGCGTTRQAYTTKDRPPDVDLTSGTQKAPSPRPPAQPVQPSLPAPAPAPQIATNRAAATPAIAVPRETWVNLARWVQANHLGSVSNVRSAAVPTFTFTAHNGVLVVRNGSTSVHWSGMELRLGNAPQVYAGELYLHTLDIQKTLMPLLEPSTIPTATPRVIVLDPGHGGHDSGTRSIIAGNWEKTYTLDLALRLKPLLEANGWEVHLTRTNDADVALQARVDFADEHNADLFLSLHFNATTTSLQAGIETYCLTPVGLTSAVTRGYDDIVTTEYPNNQFDVQNMQLAARLHRALLLGTGAEDRGVRHARFMSVLRGQQRPAVLLECGYLSNSVEAKAINTAEHRQKIAEIIAKALP
jgi:N-acetylmuramoyl-L-alanine amidase